MSDQVALYKHLFGETQDLWVIELDDPDAFPVPTWGPFTSTDDCEAFVNGAVLHTKTAVVRTRDYLGEEIARVYELENGQYLSVKKLTPPLKWEDEPDAVL